MRNAGREVTSENIRVGLRVKARMPGMLYRKTARPDECVNLKGVVRRVAWPTERPNGNLTACSCQVDASYYDGNVKRHVRKMTFVCGRNGVFKRLYKTR